MKFGSGALTVALALCGAAISTTSAFTVPRRVQHAPSITTISSSNALSLSRRPTIKSTTYRRAAAEDEDDDSYDEPLAKGVDSVAWLPTVAGAKTVVEASGSEEVS